MLFLNFLEQRLLGSLETKDVMCAWVIGFELKVYPIVRGVPNELTYLLHDIFAVNVTNDVINYDYAIKICRVIT